MAKNIPERDEIIAKIQAVGGMLRSGEFSSITLRKKISMLLEYADELKEVEEKYEL